MEEYLIIEKAKTDFQKVLNQWRHLYDFEIIWLFYDKDRYLYRALIKRWGK